MGLHHRNIDSITVFKVDPLPKTCKYYFHNTPVINPLPRTDLTPVAI